MPSRTDDPAVGEQQPLLGGPPKPTRNGLATLRRQLSADVSRDWADLVLLACYMITGLLDSASISSWGSFVSMQTGNTVYIGLGIAAPRESTRWIKSLVSLASFCLGAFAFSRFHRYFSPRRRWVLVASFTFQFALCVAAACLLTFAPAHQGAGGNDLSWNVLVPIALIAFQSCGQAVTSRALKYNALTSVVLTSIYTDLFGDADLFKGRNAERNRRVVAPLMLVVGAVGGGLFAHSKVGIAGALWLASILKLFMVAAWAFWPADAEGA
ncbi:hypothetical protein B0T11DRAFT_316874 [Plectosphaerella cucumerina]|uniref:DUF1275 domain protein n=1 Tax=Plectosphaerella cucumerina TaxID=40658 RepID=A0A8K0TQB8_9PEZI|nr:hypothetical protein B0T11DRAFT_316874 [Plectosphaerella cucumerina]